MTIVWNCKIQTLCRRWSAKIWDPLRPSLLDLAESGLEGSGLPGLYTLIPKMITSIYAVDHGHIWSGSAELVGNQGIRYISCLRPNRGTPLVNHVRLLVSPSKFISMDFSLGELIDFNKNIHRLPWALLYLSKFGSIEPLSQVGLQVSRRVTKSEKSCFRTLWST